MQSTNIIKKSSAYIEDNLKTDITPEELADMAGYSIWHYQRLFARVTGVPPAAYISRRRPEHALAEISNKRRVVDAALEYGFDSYAGFYKAFLRMYGCSPKKYLSLYGTHNSLSEVSFMFTEKQLRQVLENRDIPQDLPINDVKIVDGTKTASNVWQVGKEYLLKTGDRVILLRNARAAKAIEEHGLTAAVPVPTKKIGTLFEKLPKQLIHRDPNPCNILFSEGEVSGFTDFDLSERNVRLWDPCYCATGILSEQRRKRIR